MPSDKLIKALGHAAAAVWADLPPGAQHDLFEAAVRSAGESAREPLAVFLHGQHPRTLDGDKPRQAPEPDSLGRRHEAAEETFFSPMAFSRASAASGSLSAAARRFSRR